MWESMWLWLYMKIIISEEKENDFHIFFTSFSYSLSSKVGDFHTAHKLWLVEMCVVLLRTIWHRFFLHCGVFFLLLRRWVDSSSINLIIQHFKFFLGKFNKLSGKIKYFQSPLPTQCWPVLEGFLFFCIMESSRICF